MCPREIRGRLKAFSFSINQAFKARDEQAWMSGYYQRANFTKYPQKPAIVADSPKAMTDEQMKGVFRSLMKKQEAANGNNT